MPRETISVNGTLRDRKLGLELADGDSVLAANVQAVASSGLTVTNVRVNGAPMLVNWRTYDAGQLVLYDVEAGPDPSLLEHVDFTYSTQVAPQETQTVRVEYAIEVATVAGLTSAAGFGRETAETIEPAPPELLDSTAVAVQPGSYLLDASGGAFALTLAEKPGEWLFADPHGHTAGNPVTIGTDQETFNEAAGPLVYDGGASSIRISRISGVADMSVLVTSLTPISSADKAKLDRLTVTQAVDLDAMETDIAEHQTLFGVADGSVHLGAFTNPDASHPIVPANRTAKQALQDLIDAQAALGQINVLDYGITPGTGVTEQQALDNVDAIVAAAQAAWDAHYLLPTPGLGGSLNRRIMPPLNFAGQHIQIAKPLQIAWQGGSLTWLGHGATISRYGAEGGFEADHPGRWGIEIGEDYNLNTCPMFIYWTGFTFTGFARCLQLGFAPNNVNMGFWYFDHLHFIGPNTGHPKTFGVRAFNRSASLTFNKCMWNEFTRGLEVQSIDQLVMRDCRIQIGERMWSSDLPRPDGEAQITLRHARVTIDNFIGNPPLVNAATSAADWTANTSLVKGAYRRLSGVAYRTKRALTTKATIGAEDVSGSSPDWETIPDEAAGFANIDTQRYYWIKVQDFPAWQTNTEYVKGDIVLQPYDTGGDPLYWSRLAYTASSGATWTADRANWQPIDSMRNWQASQTVKQYDVRLATQAVANGGDGRSKFWVSNSNRTTSGTFDAAEVANWTVVTNSDALVPAITGSGASPRRSAGQPISAWHTLDVVNQSLFGAESGGLTPLYWDVPKMPLYTGGAEPRKQQTSFRIVGCGVQSDRRYPYWPQNATNDIRNGAVLRPVVVLAQIPNYGVIQDNILSKVNFAVAAMFDPYLPQPDVPLNNIANWPSHWDFLVKGNQQGSGGITAFPSAHTPYTETYRHYDANWAPEVLLEPVLDILMGTGSPLASVTAWAGAATVRLGEHRKATDPADSIEKLWRSRFTRTTGASFDATEKQYWQLVADQTESAGTFHSPLLSPSRDTYRLDNPIAITINSFARATPGKAFTVICLSNRHAFQHVAGRMRLKGSTNVTPTYGQSLTFVEMMGELWEIARNF